MDSDTELSIADDLDGPERLTNLDTNWQLIREAHTPGPRGQVAMNELIGRYHDAVARYLRLKLRDDHLADEVLQEFWTKLLTHKLAGADHSKGRFRDYLRTVLHRLIIDHFRGRKHQSLPPGDIFDPSMPDVEYERVWRDAVIRRVWTRLETYELLTPKNRYAKVLHLRVDNPDAPIEELAEQHNRTGPGQLTPDAFRKTLQRARAKFLELLIQELREGLTNPTTEDVESEINALGLGHLYRRYAEDIAR